MSALYDRIINDEIKMKAAPFAPVLPPAGAAAGTCSRPGRSTASASHALVASPVPASHPVLAEVISSLAVSGCAHCCLVQRRPAPSQGTPDRPGLPGPDMRARSQDPAVEGMLAAQASKAAGQQGGWMDTIMNLIPGRKQAASATPSEDAIQATHEHLRCPRQPYLVSGPSVAPGGSKWRLQCCSRCCLALVQQTPTCSLATCRAPCQAHSHAGPRPRAPPSTPPQRGRPSGQCWMWPGPPCWAPSASSLRSFTRVRFPSSAAAWHMRADAPGPPPCYSRPPLGLQPGALAVASGGRFRCCLRLTAAVRCRGRHQPVPGGLRGRHPHELPAGHGHAAQHLCHLGGALHAAARACGHAGQARAGVPRPPGGR